MEEFSVIFYEVTCIEAWGVILTLLHPGEGVVMVGKEGKLIFPLPAWNCTSADKGPTLQNCKIAQRLCKTLSLLRILT